MDEIFYSMVSVTYAIKARSLLRRAGVLARVVKVDPEKTQTGCMHALAIRSTDILRAAMLMRQGGIPYERYPSER